ncbi:hypothetical protein APC1504_1283 [Bifidobacterium longum]|nr:proteasome accessory factor PafA2 family protein [Bifidobacterium longum]PKC87126.1 hypothetical protein APC1504_1283 [Bifidobacterium longum]
MIIGDSNRSQWSTWMKLAVTHLVLCAIEELIWFNLVAQVILLCAALIAECRQKS